MGPSFFLLFKVGALPCKCLANITVKVTDSNDLKFISHENKPMSEETLWVIMDS